MRVRREICGTLGRFGGGEPRRRGRGFGRGVPVLLALAVLPACAGQAGTIGAALGQRADGRLFVREVPERLAARRYGLEPGDEILLIEGRDVRTMDEKAIHAALEGEVGDLVHLTIVHGEAVKRVTVKLSPAPRPTG